jgi:hypothetical protein
VDDVIGPPIRPLDRDVGCTHIEAPAGLLDSGIAVTPACSVHNSGDTAASFTVRMKIGASYNETATITDQVQHTSAYVTFPSWIASPKGTIPVSCSTELAGDVRPANDRMTGTAEVHILDVGVTSIASPSGTIESSATVAPSARVKNLGDIALTFKTFFSFDSTGATAHSYHESLTVNTLSAGTESTVVFPTWGKPHPPQTYAAKCSTYLAGDRIPANDVATGSFTVVTIIILPGWSALPNLPPGVKNKNVKDGGRLAYNAEDGTDYIYALKGNNRYEFYKFNTAINAWATMESIPAIGMTGKKKAVKKGATLVGDIDPEVPARVYAQKGNSTLDFWRYDPIAHQWIAVAPVPAGIKPCKEGCGAAVVDLGHSELGDSAYIYFLKGSGTFEFYRYHPYTNTWQTLANAPAGPKSKPFKNGSCLASNDNGASKTIYALKGSYNELYAYDPVTDVWTTKTSLPLVGSSGRKKKAKDGAGIACYADHGGYLYAVKGGNTREFWKYLADSGDRWVQLEDIPIGGGKNVKGGGAIAYAEGTGYFYILKGNNTPEFYQYVPTGYPSLLAADDPNVMAGSGLSPSSFTLCLSPNPFTNATRVSYSLPKAGNVRLKLYDISGKLVATLRSGYSPAGSSSFIVHRSSFSAGIYVLRLELDDCSQGRSCDSAGLGHQSEPRCRSDPGFYRQGGPGSHGMRNSYQKDRGSDCFFAPESRREIGKRHEFPEKIRCGYATLRSDPALAVYLPESGNLFLA